MKMEAYAQLLGAPKVRLAGVWHAPPFTKANALLYYLAFKGEWCSRDELLFLFYADTTESMARGNLRQRLISTKRLPYSQGLEIEATRLRWPIETDVRAFKEAVQEGKHPEAVEFYQGKLLEGCSLSDAPEFEAWLEAEREELHSQWRDAVFSLAKELEGSGRHLQAGEVLEKLYRSDPFDEEVLQRYLQTLYLGGQRSKALAVSASFKKQLQEEYGGEPEAETLQLIERIERNEQGSQLVIPFPKGLEAKQEPRHNLPVQATPFVGREEEKEKLSQLLSDPSCRLLTIVGPGGMGKTRLANEAAREELDAFRDGVYFVNMVPVTSAELMIYAIGQAIGFSFFGQQEPKEQVLDYLRNKEMLLVLDNLEHLLSGIHLVSDILERAPDLKLLATSRLRLDLRAERVFDLHGLSVPELNEAGAQEHDAVKLFVQRAISVHADFSLNDTTLPAVIRICQLVRGLPLAIELAASWLRALPVKDIAAEIERGIDVLEASTRDLPERHRSIRAVFDYSWRLLTDEEQEVLRKLSVFQGGFRREAAADIARAGLPILASLVDKSFLTLTPTGRYRRHPLVIQYTQERLAEHPEEKAQAAERHGLYYLRLVQEREADLRTRKRKVTLAALEEELSNIRVAWSWAIENERVDEIRTAAWALDAVYANRIPEGKALFAEAISGLDEHNPAHHAALGYVLLSQANFLFFETGNEDADKLVGRSLELLRPLGEVAGVMRGLHGLGMSRWVNGDSLQAKALFQEGLDLARTHGTPRDISTFLFNLAKLEFGLGSIPQVRQFCKEAMAEVKRLNDLVSLAELKSLLGVFLAQNDYVEEGENLIHEALALMHELGIRGREPLNYLVMKAYELGDYDRAEEISRESLAVAKEVGNRFTEVNSLTLLGKVATSRGHYPEAQRYLRESLRVARAANYFLGIPYPVIFLSELYIAIGHAKKAVPWLGWVRQQPTFSKGHEREVERLLKNLREQLPPAELEEALECGKKMKLEEVVQELLATL